METSLEHLEVWRTSGRVCHPGDYFVFEDWVILDGVAVHGDPHLQGLFGSMRLQLGDWTMDAVWVREDCTNVIFLHGGVSLSLFCPYVVYEPKSGFVGTNGTAYDVEYSTPFIEDEGGAAHE